MHDSHLTGDNPSDLRQHAKNLRKAGISYYKLLVGGVNKVERARIYTQEGIMCIVRLYAERPHPRFQPNRDEVAQYVAAGARYFEAGNEPNLLDETEGGINPEADAAQWIRASDTIKSAGGIPVVYACTPGGHMNHRTYTTRFIAEVRRLGRLDSFDRAVLGIHPRPLNNPPDAAVGTGNPPNTTTWNEWTWYRDTYRTALGWTIPMIATEHGYSGGGQENGEHPPMNDLTWAEWNKELFNRFNPSHPKALPPEFLAATYWLEVNHGVWIHDGPFANNGREWIGDAPRQDDRAWGKALWTIQPNWNRAGATVPPPPPPETPVPPTGGSVNLPAWVTVNRVTVAPGQQYWKLQAARYQDDTQSGGLHHIFIEQPHDASKSFNVSNGSQSWNVPLDKPLNEPAGNFAMFAGNVYAAKMNGLPSDTVIGMKMPSNHHVNYLLEYALVTQPAGGFMIDRRYMGRAGMGENYGARPAGVGVDGLILHHTGGGFAGSLEWLTNATSGVGAHYLIDRDGAIYQLVEDFHAAWHAGYSILNGREDCNRFTLGVELVNAGDGNDPYPQVQQDALVWLIREKARQHEFTRAWVETHQKVRADYKARYPNATNPDGSPIGYKTDPRGLNVAAILDRVFPPVVPPPPPPPPPVEPQWGKVVWAMEQAARILQAEGFQREHDAVLSDISYVDAVRERDN